MLHVLTECPKSLIKSSTNTLLEFAITQQRYGGLPEAGGLYDQPALAMEVIDIYRDEISKLEAYLVTQRSRDIDRTRKTKPIPKPAPRPVPRRRR